MQFVIWFVIPATRSPQANHNNNALALIVLLQYVPRLYLIFPLSTQIIKATGVVTKTAWAGAAYNLLLYMLASHVCCSKLPFYPPWLQRCKLSLTLFLLLGFRGIMVFAFSWPLYFLLEITLQTRNRPYNMLTQLFGLQYI